MPPETRKALNQLLNVELFTPVRNPVTIGDFTDIWKEEEIHRILEEYGESKYERGYLDGSEVS